VGTWVASVILVLSATGVTFSVQRLRKMYELYEDERWSHLGLVEDWALIVLCVLYLCSAVVTVVATVKTTWSDPTDPTVKMERDADKLPAEEAKKVFNKGDYEYYCSVCSAHVI
jgi:hypothetical protein